MTDRELLDLWYEHVLKWRLNRDGTMWLLPDGMGIGRNVESEAVTAGTGWSPLTSLDDAFAGLRAHPEWRWDLRHRDGGNGILPSFSCVIWMRPKEDPYEWSRSGRCDSPNRAIVLAGLRAVGFEVDA